MGLGRKKRQRQQNPHKSEAGFVVSLGWMTLVESQRPDRNAPADFSPKLFSCQQQNNLFLVQCHEHIEIQENKQQGRQKLSP